MGAITMFWHITIASTISVFKINFIFSSLYEENCNMIPPQRVSVTRRWKDGEHNQRETGQCKGSVWSSSKLQAGVWSQQLRHGDLQSSLLLTTRSNSLITTRRLETQSTLAPQEPLWLCTSLSELSGLNSWGEGYTKVQYKGTQNQWSKS